MIEQICRRCVNTEKLKIRWYSYKYSNIATALKTAFSCKNLTINNRNVCCKILALLTETHEEIAPEIGLEWSASLTAPIDMDDHANTEPNRLLAEAVEQIPMLRDARINGKRGN